MSSAEVAARVVKELESEDWRVLYAFERTLSSSQATSLEILARISGLHEDEVNFRVGRLHGFGLIIRSPPGYSLLTAGLDAIALQAYVKRNLVEMLGRPLGIGKEADVYDALAPEEEGRAIKFFRLGRISFRAVRRKRGYTWPLQHHHWLMVNISAAAREARVLARLGPLGVSVPVMIGRERHTVLMKRIDGALLPEWKELEDPKRVLMDILADLRLAYTKAGLVNGDLSEFNILYDGSRIFLIDWPQAVDKSHPNSSMLLDRDILNVISYFRRRFRVDFPLEPASLYVRGWIEDLKVP